MVEVKQADRTIEFEKLCIISFRVFNLIFLHFCVEFEVLNEKTDYFCERFCSLLSFDSSKLRLTDLRPRRAHKPLQKGANWAEFV